MVVGRWSLSMISANRIVAIFSRRGGSGEFTKTAGELISTERERLQAALEGESPLIASVRSKDEWFAFTEKHIAKKSGGTFRRVKLREVASLISAAGGRSFEHGRKYGGVVQVRLKDGSTLSFETESGGPWVGLMNVVLYLERVNRNSATGLATTNDERPTTQL